MNKVVELLEQHCQWIAIALGGIFLAFIAWSYVLTSPVAVEVPGQPPLTPGNVDTEVSRVATAVQDQIADPRVRAPAVAKQGTEIERHVQKMNGDVAEVLTVATGGSYGSMAFTPEIRDPKDLPDAPELVEALPSVPPSEILPDVGIKAALAQVVLGPVGGQPGQPGQPMQPIQPPAPGAAPVLPANATDINYVRGEYRIEPSEILKAWNAVKVPPGQTTLILGIKVMRQELKADGKWSDPVEVQPLDNGIRPWPIPPANAGFQAIGQFEAWFAGPQGQSDLLRPPFYQLISGEGPWDEPFNLDAAIAAVKAQRETDRLNRNAENEQARQNRVRRPPQGPPEGGEPDRPRRGPRRGEPEFKIEDPTRPSNLADLAGLELAQVDPRRNPTGPRGYFDPNDIVDAPPDDMGNMGQPWNQPGQPAQPGLGQPQMPALPPAQFDPRQTPTIFGWFFDTQVKEGHTYRYQVLYAIKSPMWQSNQVNNPALAQVYAIWSKLDEDAWSQPRTVQTATRYYIADRSWQAGSVPNAVRMEVFKWVAGKWQSRVFSVSAGDEIGWDEVGTDWGTQSRLVDVRFDERLEKAYLLVMGPDGKIAERDPLSDRIDINDERAALRLLIQQQQLPAGASAGGVPPVAGR